MLNRNNKITITDEYRTSASDTLKETLDYYHITQSDFAERIGVSQKTVSEILNRKQFMSTDIAIRIEEVTGIPAKMLLNLDLEYKIFLKKKEQNREDKNHSPNYLKPYEWAMG
jgi:addiction module HigA family antidote